MEIVFTRGTLLVLILSSILCTVTPIVLVFYYKKHYDAKTSSFFIGMAGYFLFEMIFFQFLVGILFSVLPSVSQIPWQSAFYRALLSALSGCFARFIMIKYTLKNRLTIGNALLYGVGHGGLYAMTYGTSLCIANAVTMIFNNYLGTTSYIQKLGLKGEELVIAEKGIKQLSEISTLQHFFDGTAPFLILFIEVALSVFIFIFITDVNAKILLPTSFLLHFIVLLSYNFEKVNIIASPMITLFIILIVTIFGFYYANRLKSVTISSVR